MSIRGGLRRASAALRRHGSALLLSVASQGISSLTTFGLTLCLVRLLDKNEFGLYSLGFASLLLLSGLVSSFICMQYVVNIPDQPLEQRESYAMHHVAGAALFGLILIGTMGGLSFSGGLEILGADSFQGLALPVAVASATYSLRDLLTRVAYSERREFAVLVSNVTVGLTVLCVMVGAIVSGLLVTAGGALCIYALAQVAGSVIGLPLFRLPWHRFRWQGLYHVFLDCWRGGRWAVLTSLLYNLRAQVHNFVIPPLLGMAALADVNAARVLVTPGVMAIPPLTQVLTPRLADQRSRGMSALLRGAAMAVGGLSGIAFAYALILMTCLPWLLPYALGDSYRHIEGQVLAWCLVTLLLALRNGLSLALQVLRAFRELMLANLVAGVLSIVVAIFFVRTLGGVGAIIAHGLAELVLCIGLGAVLLNRARSYVVGMGR